MALGLSVTLGSLRLRSPLVAASGTVGSVWEWAEVADVRPYGAAVAKSVSAVPWTGRPAPRMAPTDAGMLNGIGIQNPGVVEWLETVAPRFGTLDVPIWGSVVGETPADFAKVASTMSGVGLEAIEINLSCPNIADGAMFSLDHIASRDVVAAVREGVSLPIGAKLSPNSPDVVKVATSCIEAGADFLTLTNTALGFGVDATSRRPLLSGGVGGYSGPGLKPISLRCVYEVARAFPGFPLVGCGGVSRGGDVVEYLLAGASAVQIGTAHFAEPKAGSRIHKELAKEMKKVGVSDLGELVGGMESW